MSKFHNILSHLTEWASQSLKYACANFIILETKLHSIIYLVLDRPFNICSLTKLMYLFLNILDHITNSDRKWQNVFGCLDNTSEKITVHKLTFQQATDVSINVVLFCPFKGSEIDDYGKNCLGYLKPRHEISDQILHPPQYMGRR